MERIIQITSGRGPEECSWVVKQLLKIFLEEAKQKSIETHLLSEEEGIGETALILLEAKNLDAFVDSWVGTILWIGQSPFRKFHKRKNWFVGIFEVEKTNALEILEKDIHYQTMRSSGAGGQHVNKVSSAVRAIHVPTGISAMASDSRSQHQNKKLATERLMQKFQNEAASLYKNDIQNQWNNQLQIERGNPVRVFRGLNFEKK